MVTAAIYCDDSILKKILTSCINRICLENKFSISLINSQTDGSYPDLLLIDDKYQGNGFLQSVLLRQNGCASEIIFLMSVPENVYQTFDFSPSSCLIKPFLFNDVNKSVTDAVRSIASSELIRFRTRHSYKEITSDEIICIVAQGRYTNISTVSGSVECTESITSLEKRLPEIQFFRTHRTYILNLRHIDGITDNMIRMVNGELAVLSRNRRSEFEHALKIYRSRYRKR